VCITGKQCTGRPETLLGGVCGCRWVCVPRIERGRVGLAGRGMPALRESRRSLDCDARGVSGLYRRSAGTRVPGRVPGGDTARFQRLSWCPRQGSVSGNRNSIRTRRTYGVRKPFQFLLRGAPPHLQRRVRSRAPSRSTDDRARVRAYLNKRRLGVLRESREHERVVL